MNILVLEHHPLMGEALKMLICRVYPSATVLVADSIKVLNVLIEKYNAVHFLIMDPKVNGSIGPGLLSYLVLRMPDAKVVVFTDSDMEIDNDFYLDRGAYCVIDKKSKLNQITSIFQRLLVPVSPSVDSSIPRINMLKLSKRHRQLIGMLEQGLSNEAIAKQLNISENTVKVHFWRLFKLMGVRSRMQALHYAKSHGWFMS